MPDPGRLDAYDYHLPEEQIAQAPAARREGSRLLVLDKRTGGVADRWFYELPELLREGDLLVINDTRVFPARLRGRRVPTGGRAELLLVEQRKDGTWEALAKPARRLQPGSTIEFGEGLLAAEIVEVLPDGRRVVRFASERPFWEVIEEVGEPPLPPYIRRAPAARPEDAERYQTVYARERGSVAAPTAGLHFTEPLLEAVRARGVAVERLTLHVGYGTFEPVRVEDLGQHRVAPERYAIPEATAAAVARARARGARVVAVGTTSTRTLETAHAGDGLVRAGGGLAELTVTPGYSFAVVDGLITNFHLPKSSLLVMVAAFGGYQHVMDAYRHAVQAGYRFYSYGDAMLIY